MKVKKIVKQMHFLTELKVLGKNEDEILYRGIPFNCPNWVLNLKIDNGPWENGEEGGISAYSYLNDYNVQINGIEILTEGENK